MNSISMSTSDLRAMLREAEGKELGITIRFAHDIPGPGGSAFIAGNSKLTERHLDWLEHRNPVAGNKPTYVQVVIAHETRSARSANDSKRPAEPAESAGSRRKRAEQMSREVVARADEVAKKAVAIHRIVGGGAFSASALRNRDVLENLQELNQRIENLHASVRAALDEYLIGNTLIMDLIAQHDLATRPVQHGLNVAVFATEISSQVVLKGHHQAGGLEGYYGSLSEEEVQARLGDEADGEDSGEPTEDDRRWKLFKKDLAEIFLGGFMHDCGLWDESSESQDNHEELGAKIIFQIPELRDFLPSLTRIILFHSDILRMATRPGLVQVIDHPDDPEKISFGAEFYRSVEDAQTAVRLRGNGRRSHVLSDEDLHKVLPVAMAEYCISQTAGFNARSRAEVASRLASHAEDGAYLWYVVALCNAQLDVVAPRRAYVELSGSLTAMGAGLGVEGFVGGSIGHSDDIYSPHLITLFRTESSGLKKRLGFVSPHDGNLWTRTNDPSRRMYIPAGRHTQTLSVRVTGFMSEDIYSNILGEYELELKRQMQA